MMKDNCYSDEKDRKLLARAPKRQWLVLFPIALVAHHVVFQLGRLTTYFSSNPHIYPEGKSCSYTNKRWHCHECHNETGCVPLKPRGVCGPFRRQEWDDLPRKASHYNSDSIHNKSNIITHFNLKQTFEQPDCSLFEPTCFNLRKCQAEELTVYTENITSLAHDLVQAAVDKRLVTRVLNPQDACLIILSPDMPFHLYDAGGKNHFLWRSNEFMKSHPDRPFHANLGVAATASSAFTQAHIRPNYDMSIALDIKWKVNDNSTNAVEIIGKSRPILLSFKGNIYKWKQPYWQHRWLAAEYWEESEDVVVDVTCRERRNYKLREDNAYGNLLLNSTFGFCPGGGAVSSYRFGEVLSAGGIPVILPEMVPPFSPELDWSDCVVRVPESRIIDLPGILRRMSKKEVKQRQAACYRLYEKVLSGNQDESQFAVAMRLWKSRIKLALHAKKELEKVSKKILE